MILQREREQKRKAYQEGIKALQEKHRKAKLEQDAELAIKEQKRKREEEEERNRREDERLKKIDGLKDEIATMEKRMTTKNMALNAYIARKTQSDDVIKRIEVVNGDISELNQSITAKKDEIKKLENYSIK